MAAPLLSLALSIAAQQGRLSAERAARRWRRKALLWGLIGLLTLGTAGALTTALALVLSSEIGPVGAALALAAGMAGLALGLIALLLFYQRRDRRQAAASRQAWSLVGSALGTVVPNMVQRTPFSALVATGAAAFLLSLWLNPVNSSPKEGERGPHQTKD